MTPEPAKQGHDKCMATTRGGGSCQRPAGWGTDFDHGRCKLHGGSTPNHVKRAEVVEATRAVQAFGLPRSVSPHEALEEELHRAAGWVRWLEDSVIELGEGELVKEVQMEDGAYKNVSPYYELLNDERTRLVKVAAACIAANVDERRVRVIEQGAQFAAQAIRAFAGNMGIDLDSPKVRHALTQALSVVPAA